MPLKKNKKTPKKVKKVSPIKKKKPVKKQVKKARKSALKPQGPKAKENLIGEITHYFSKVRAAVIKLKAPLNMGDTIKIKGHTTDFTQTISSMQLDHAPINSAKKGQEIGVMVNSRARQGDLVSKPKLNG